jgi:hypothetical protein
MGTLATMVGVWLVSRATLGLKDHQQ